MICLHEPRLNRSDRVNVYLSPLSPLSMAEHMRSSAESQACC